MLINYVEWTESLPTGAPSQRAKLPLTEHEPCEREKRSFGAPPTLCSQRFACQILHHVSRWRLGIRATANESSRRDACTVSKQQRKGGEESRAEDVEWIIGLCEEKLSTVSPMSFLAIPRPPVLPLRASTARCNENQTMKSYLECRCTFLVARVIANNLICISSGVNKMFIQI